jgi:hypothetical protein
MSDRVFFKNGFRHCIRKIRAGRHEKAGSEVFQDFRFQMFVFPEQQLPEGNFLTEYLE